MCKFTTRPERGNNAQKSPMRFMGLGKMLALMLVFFAGMNLSAVAQVAQNAMPGQSVKTCSIAKGGNNISLTVKGNMPQTAKVTATQVQRTAPNGKQALGAYDITITNGKKVWQPASGQPVMVSISDPDFTDGELLDVYHEGANGLEFVATVSPENGKITFPAKSFSVYIVTESGAGARLKVNFHQIDGSIVPIYVKAADATDAETYKTVLYDPGVGTIADGVQFRGWTQEENYDVEDADNGMTIAQVRTLVQPMLANVTDGNSIDLYPMLFKLYHVTYLDELGAVLTSQEVLFLLNSDEGYHECEINHYYEPATSEQHFLGWDVADGEEHIQNYVDDTHYQNGTSININGNIKLRAYVPYGHWLVFKENGAGASFTTAQFIENGQNTVEPTDPARFGYTFGGWYTDADCTEGNEFEFGHPITENTNLYAKWTENTSANYTVIIWKQNVHDSKNATDATKTYDFAESFSFTGTVGESISTVTAQGTGNGRYASVNGNSIQYAGFHLNKFDENVTIVTEGNSVVNVYYDRNLITLTFQYRNNNQWATQATMTGLYGSSLAENNYTWPTNRWWYDDYNYTYGGYSGSGTRTTFLDAFLLSDGGDSQTYYGFEGNGNNSIHFLKKNEDGTYTEANTMTSGNGTFNISDKYNGYRAESYSTNNTTWTALGDKDPETGYYGQVSNYTNLYIRYAPLLYNILYEDGVFVDGNGNAVEDVTPSSNLKTVYDVPFESSIASYNKGGANYFEPVRSGFAFEGWYIDDACTQPYTFTNMPEGITVYAKWIQIQYRVFFHPNAVDPVTGENDPSFDWPEGQDFNFRVDYNEHVSTPHANRDDYTLVGWYTDEACTQVFNGEMIALNEQTVTAEYDKTVDMTDPVDEYGNIPTTGAENHDVDRFWINNKLDLYAKWRSKLEGAKGIQIKYVFIDEDVNVILVQQEEDIFNDNVTTFSIPAPTSFDGMPNPQDSVFFQWVIQHWDESANDFVDSDVTVYPGSPYSVNKADAQRTDNPDYDPENPTAQDQYVYTIQVRAEYIPVEKVTPTFIVWYNNYENADPDTLRQDGKLNATDPHANLFINQAVGIPTPAERAGYKFLGWYKANISSQAEVGSVIDVTEPNFLFYNEEDGKYYAEAAFTNKADSVAADEANPYDYLYAVWEQTCNVPEVTVADVTVCEGTPATLEATITELQDGVTYTYQWYTIPASGGDAAPIENAKDAAYETTTAGTYGVIVSAGENCESEMATAEVTVNPMAEVTIEGAGEICAGEEATLTATLSEEEANNVTYQWYIVNADLTETEIEGATDATYKTTQFGTYKVIVTYNTVCTAWATATLTPNPDVTPEIEISKKEQTVVYGNEIEDVTVTSNTEITFEPTPVPEGFAFEDGVLTSNLPEVGTYNFYVTAESPCGKKSDTIKVIVTPKTLTITGNFTKTYDGELFVVNATELTYTGLVGDDEITEGTITSEDYVYGTYKCTDGQFLRTMEDMAAIQAGFGPEEVTKNYTPSFNVTLNIDKKAITVTAASDEKVYDGEPLVNGEYTIDELAEGDEATVTVEGSITCVGEADNTPVVSAIVRTVDEDRDVMDSYEITLVKGKLVVTPVENALECATEETVIEMKDCELTKVVTVEDLTSTPTVTGIDEAHYTLVNNLDELNPMSEGVYEIVWTLTDDCGNAMATCTQTVKLQYGACEGINGYEAVRIGSQCWMKENLKEEEGTYKAYKDDDANLEKFGYLYTWYTAMGLDEGDDSTDPWANAPTDACGNPYVQGICPEGWAVGSDADYALLGATAGDASFLKDPSTEYWLPEKAGKEEGNLGFNARGGGWFNSAVNDFEDIYAAFRYWTPDMESGSAYATSGSINYFCNVPQTVLVKKSDMMSVRCIRKVQE